MRVRLKSIEGHLCCASTRREAALEADIVLCAGGRLVTQHWMDLVEEWAAYRGPFSQSEETGAAFAAFGMRARGAIVIFQHL